MNRKRARKPTPQFPLRLDTEWILSSLLAYRIVIGLTSDKSLGWMSAFLYASAITVHLDALVWIVGFYNVARVSLSFDTGVIITCREDEFSFSRLAAF